MGRSVPCLSMNSSPGFNLLLQTNLHCKSFDSLSFSPYCRALDPLHIDLFPQRKKHVRSAGADPTYVVHSCHHRPHHLIQHSTLKSVHFDWKGCLVNTSRSWSLPRVPLLNLPPPDNRDAIFHASFFYSLVILEFKDFTFQRSTDIGVFEIKKCATLTRWSNDALKYA
jgi:hypothetical protein